MSKGRSIIPSERKLDSCLNCGQALDRENFCPNCGQENADRNISFWTLIKDFLGDYFSFDSKIFSTLFPLMIHPGRVPEEFIEGKRVKHIPPLRILIFSSFLFFFIWGITYEPEVKNLQDVPDLMNQQLEEELKKNEMNPQDSVVTLGNDIFQLNLTGLDSTEDSETLDKADRIRGLIDQGMRVEQAVDSIATDNSEFERKMYIQIGRMYTSDTATISKYFISNLSVIILVMQPFFALLLKLLYIRNRKRFRFIQHLVFSLYYHGWILIMATIGLLISQVFSSLDPMIFPSILALIYLPIALKRFYKQAWWKTLLKTFIISMAYLGLITPFFFLLSFFLSFYFF